MARNRERLNQETFEDPVCGMEVSYKTATTEFPYRGRRYYFCSVSCREQFAEDPKRYVGAHRQRKAKGR